MPLPLTEPKCHLSWPAGIFTEEFNHIYTYGNAAQFQLLLQEAFNSPFLSELFANTTKNLRHSQNVPVSQLSSELVTELHSRLGELKESADKLPYYHQRTISFEESSSGASNEKKFRREFAGIVHDFERSGFLDNAFGKDCVDNPRIDPDHKLYELLHIPNLWPLQPDEWSEEVTFSLIEAFHDLVARPRSIAYYHDYLDCGPHFRDFAPEPGQALYCNRVNKFLARYQHRFRLSTMGEDKGRLVVVSDIGREDLVQSSIEIADIHSNDVRHAIGLFRSRSVSREDKQSAILALAKILERERAALKHIGLASKDENALFEIANKFDLRHGNNQQLSNYRDSFLDWIFWWYLATVDLLRALR